MPNIEALEQLKRVVRDAPDERFDMSTLDQLTPCGTARCALGHCIIDRWFRENTSLEKATNFTGGRTSGRINYVYGHLVADVFGITEYECDHLFALEFQGGTDVFRNISKADVIANADRLIEGDSVVPYVGYWGDDDDRDHEESTR